MYEYVKTLDKELDEYATIAFKIRDRDMKKEILAEIQACKEKTFNFMEVLRSTQGKIPNAQIAKLNDLAYKGVQKRGMQKKLDERALKNEQFYKKLTKQVKDVTKDFKLDQLQEEHKELAQVVGNCPLSCNDLFEALQSGDSMCLALDVARSEACIADPSRLVIKDIIPTFMTADSFLDSAVFNLRKDSQAHGGFTGSSTTKEGEAKLAMGIGRENITGVMPLYLFKEHWEIARRKAPPIYGFLCTLDIMGYASSQYFTIPFLVLLKAIEKANEPSSPEIYKKIRDMVLQTCKIIFLGNEEFRKNTLKQIEDFLKSPENRTADIVTSIRVMLAQLYTFMQIENYQEYLSKDSPALKLDKENLNIIFRYAFEEQLRRSIKHDQEPLSKTQILKLLWPDYSAHVDQVMAVRKKEIDREFSKGSKGDESEAMQRFFDMAMMFKVLDKESQRSKSLIEEEKKEAEPLKVEQQKDEDKSEATNIFAIIDEALHEKPWRKLIMDEKSGLGTIVKLGAQAFKNKLKVLIDIANDLKLSEDATLTGFESLPLINGSLVLLAAILVQNVMQPSNVKRREAIAAKNYNELKNTDEAEVYFSDMLSQNLKLELAGRESSIMAAYIQAASGMSADLFLEAPDIHFAAAVLLQEAFLIGNGGRNQIIYSIMKAGPKCKAIPAKLKLIQLRKFHGHKLFHDKWENQKDVVNQPICKKTIFQLWLTLVRVKKVITSEEFQWAFPDITSRIQLWDDCVDELGKPSLDYDKFWDHIKKRNKEKRLAKQLAMAQKKAGKKF